MSVDKIFAFLELGQIFAFFKGLIKFLNKKQVQIKSEYRNPKYKNKFGWEMTQANVFGIRFFCFVFGGYSFKVLRVY
jgi:hypothetical protein